MSGAGFDRARAIERLGSETYDVVVIGAGVTGAGVALDAASRGLRTALVEGADIASGTSSRSSKMVHGGFRYLQQGEIGLVFEALNERQRLLANAPHLVRVLPFMIPVHHKGGVVPKRWAFVLGLALWVYYLLGGWRIGKRHRRLDPAEIQRHMPTLRAEDIARAYLYYDASVDDARLALVLARTAALRFGAAVANHVPVVGVAKDDRGRVSGVTVDTGAGRVEVRARSVVNASGVWVEEVETLDRGTTQDSIRPAKGVHLVVPSGLLGNDVAVILPVAGGEGTVFAVPWGGHTYVGTTDTDYPGDLDTPYCSASDATYLLDGLNASIREPVAADAVQGSWAGLRPLLHSGEDDRTEDLSRRHRVTRSASGMVTVAGGKLTTYRAMAEDTVDEVLRGLGFERRCRTKSLSLQGADGRMAVDHRGLDTALRDHLVARYGGEARELLAMIESDASLGQPLVVGLPYVAAEARFAVRHEMARTLDDVLARRTRARLFARDASAAAADSVARLVADELGWSPEEEAEQVAAYRRSVAAEADALSHAAPLVPAQVVPSGWVPGVVPRLRLPGASPRGSAQHPAG